MIIWHELPMHAFWRGLSAVSSGHYIEHIFDQTRLIGQIQFKYTVNTARRRMIRKSNRWPVNRKYVISDEWIMVFEKVHGLYIFTFSTPRAHKSYCQQHHHHHHLLDHCFKFMDLLLLDRVRHDYKLVTFSHIFRQVNWHYKHRLKSRHKPMLTAHVILSAFFQFLSFSVSLLDRAALHFPPLFGSSIVNDRLSKFNQ